MSDVERTVFLQIGEPKTGTTFIQEAMWRNRALLAGRGLRLPGIASIDHYWATQDLLGSVRAPDDPSPEWAGRWDALVEATLAAPGRSVLSHELISYADEAQIARAAASFGDAELHVVLSVRDMVSLLPAEWQETVKHRNTDGWQEWVAGVVDVESTDPDRRRFGFWRCHDTAALLELWSRHVDPSRIHVLTVPPPSAPRSLLWERFTQVVGVDGRGADLVGARGNTSLGIAEAELLRRTNERVTGVPDWFYMEAVKDFVARDVLGARTQSPRLRLAPDRRAWARDHGTALAERLAAGPWDVVGDLHDLVPPETDDPGIGPEEADTAVMLEAAVEALAAVIARQHALVRDRARPQLAIARALSLRFPAVRRIGSAVAGRPALARRLGLRPRAAGD